MCYQCKIILVASTSWLYRCNIRYKDVIKHFNVRHKFIYMLLTLASCVLIQKYLHVAGHDFDLGLDALASSNITTANIHTAAGCHDIHSYWRRNFSVGSTVLKLQLWFCCPEVFINTTLILACWTELNWRTRHSWPSVPLDKNNKSCCRGRKQGAA